MTTITLVQKLDNFCKQIAGNVQIFAAENKEDIWGILMENKYAFDR